MASIFISRAIDQNTWHEKLGLDHTIVGQSLIKFSPVDFDMPPADWVFFYSKNGVKYFFEQSQGQLAPYRWAAFGPKTAKLLSEYVLDVDFIGSGDPESTAMNFQNQLSSHEKVCFARAKNSRKSIQKNFPKEQVVDLIVYDNVPLEQHFDNQFDILIFTSPLNVRAYFEYNKHKGEQLIAIGETTYLSLKELGYIDVIKSSEPTEESVLEAVNYILEAS